MKALYPWLGEFVDLVGVDPAHAAESLTLAGIAVDAITDWRRTLGAFRAARIEAFAPHPAGAGLHIATVFDGSGKHQVVCGAANVRTGDMVPLALPGQTLPSGQAVTALEIKGVPSAGMLCSQRELGFSDDHTGVWILPAGVKPGDSVATALGAMPYLLELDITPNRPDILSHRGLAREVAAVLNRPLHLPPASVREDAAPAAARATVAIHDRVGCPWYAARVIEGVKVAASPPEIQLRLRACGIRPINNVVDATNYVLLECGHPLHAFDLDTIDGRRIVVRRAVEGERFTTLDAVERILHADDLVIASASKPVALAGVMGGAETEVTEATVNVLLEAAYFDPKAIRRSSKRHGIHSEASHRFERGADPAGIPYAMDRAASLIAEWAGGRVLAGVVEEKGPLPEPKPQRVRYHRVHRILGCRIEPAEIIALLQRLHFEVAAADDDGALFHVPSWRVDIGQEADLIEEVARLYGYGKIPATLPRAREGVRAVTSDGEERLGQTLRQYFTGHGLAEAITYGFVSRGLLETLRMATAVPLVAVANPLSEDTGVMRPNLLAGLLRVAATNYARQIRDVRLFETGRVFRAVAGQELPEEHVHVAGVLCGKREPLSWHAPEQDCDFFDAKGLVEGLLEALGVAAVRFEVAGLPYLHPGRAAFVFAGSTRLGRVGEIHPQCLEDIGIAARTAVFELDIDRVASLAARRDSYPAPPPYPGVARDLAFLVDAPVPFARLEEAARAALAEVAAPLVRFDLFDVYAGERIEAGKKSVAVRLEFRSAGATLRDEDASTYCQSVITRLEQELGARLRA